MGFINQLKIELGIQQYRAFLPIIRFLLFWDCNMLHIMKKFLEFKFSDEKQSCFNLDFMTFFFVTLWFCKEVSSLTAKSVLLVAGLTSRSIPEWRYTSP